MIFKMYCDVHAPFYIGLIICADFGRLQGPTHCDITKGTGWKEASSEGSGRDGRTKTRLYGTVSPYFLVASLLFHLLANPRSDVYIASS